MQYPFLKRPEGVNCDSEVRFTIATLVNDHAQYDEMLASMRSGGFDGADCEYLFIDNTCDTQTCAFEGLNAALDVARGGHVILCHQDIRLIDDGYDALVHVIADLDARDPNWALAGNAGGVSAGQLALRISDPHGSDRAVGDLPSRVMSLDENFIVVRRSARVGFSNDLSGFHFYGADICLAADVLGWSAYVVDFHIAHLSSGKKGASFGEMEAAFRSKWSNALRPRWMQTTCSLMRLAGHFAGRLAGRFVEIPVAKLSRRLPGAMGWSGKSSRPARCEEAL